VDVHVHQAFDNPTIFMEIDRARPVDWMQLVMWQRTFSFLSAPLSDQSRFWLDPKNGVEYSVAVQGAAVSSGLLSGSPEHSDSGSAPGAAPQILGNLVQTRKTERAPKSRITPAADDHVYAAVDGATSAVSPTMWKNGVQSHRKRICPKGSHRYPRQVQTMKSSFTDSALDCRAIVLAYLLIVVNFQSWLDPFILLRHWPGRPCGHLLDAAAYPQR